MHTDRPALFIAHPSRRAFLFALVLLVHALAFLALRQRIAAPSVSSAPIVYLDLRVLSRDPGPRPPLPATVPHRAEAGRQRNPPQALAPMPMPLVPVPSRPEPAREPVRESAAPDAPRLDVGRLREAAGADERRRPRDGLERQQESAARDTGVEARVGAGAGRAERADCRQAHAGAGLFAAVPLLLDTLRDKGCKW